MLMGDFHDKSVKTDKKELGTEEISIVGKKKINHPFGNGLYHLFMVIWGMVYYCFTHIMEDEFRKEHGH